MSEQITPILLFDVDLRDSLEFIDIEADQLTTCLKDCQLSDDVIKDTIIEFKSGLGPKTESELGYAYAETNHRKITIYLGTYALNYNHPHVQPSYESLEESSMEATVALSRDLAHEGEYLRQFEEGELPPRSIA